MEEGEKVLLVGEALDDELVDDVPQRPREQVTSGHGGGDEELSRGMVEEEAAGQLNRR